MDQVTQQQARELQAIFSSPAELLAAINDRLNQVQVIALRLTELGWQLDQAVPEQVQRVGGDATGIAYLADGMTAPRADGAVRIRAWDDAIEAAQASDDEPTRRWGAARAAQPWVFIQDTLKVPALSADQRLQVGTNCSNARFSNALIGGSQKGFAWPAFRVFINDEGNVRMGDEIPDAFSVNDDLVDLTGKVRARGFWASDMARLAERSLLHFILTSGKATQPLTAGSFGGRKAGK